MKLYQILTEKQLDKFLKEHEGKTVNQKTLIELKEPEFGDYIVSIGYKFKKIYSHYQCMETPEEKHKIREVRFTKNPNDSLSWKK